MIKRLQILHLIAKHKEKKRKDSAQPAVGTDKNIKMAATTDEKSESDSEMPNIYEGGIFKKKNLVTTRYSDCCCKYYCGKSVLLLKTKRMPYLFIHFSPSLTSSLRDSVNTVAGVFPAQLFSYLYSSRTIFSSSCIKLPVSVCKSTVLLLLKK